MKKPICLLMEDFKHDLVAVINHYRAEGVPCFLLEPIMKELHGQTISVKMDEIAAVKKDYAAKLEKEAAESAESEVAEDGDGADHS